MLYRKNTGTSEQFGIEKLVPRHYACPAKTYQTDGGPVIPGRTVDVHCQIVGEVARELINRFPADMAQALFPIDAPFAAACHDIGKVSPCFYEKLCGHFTNRTNVYPKLPVNPQLERNWGGHAGVSQLAAKAMDAPKWVPEILGQHHGFTPPVAGLRANDEKFGGTAWQAEREALVTELKMRLNMDWPAPQSPAQARLLAGLTSVADWIGSGQHFEDPAQPWKPSIQSALNSAGFIPPTYKHGLSFGDVFGFEPRSTQSILIDAVTGPGIYVLEAPMGLGKTEAALYAAYQLLQREQATGIYFALPTQLTSNKLHERFEAFLKTILAPDRQHHALLLHASAWLQKTEMGEEGAPGGAWFNHKKRGLLAPFAVGTIDQALMAAMNVKHGFVRAFGLAGKVVVLDEVHTYDAYTGTLLDALVQLLRELHCTVIILSATLNQARRSTLISTDLESTAYPLVTACAATDTVHELAVPPPAAQPVQLRMAQDEAACVQEALERAASGQQVLWIENTVKDAQERYLDIASRAAAQGLGHGLLHSRFTRFDRQQIEDHWVSLYGRPGWSQRSAKGRILVGTQVLEQSLDIDADFLVTRFAPTDMLLQRMGRLWRHADTPRPRSAACEAWLLAPELAPAVESPLAAFGDSAWVYAPYVLCRSLEVWQGCTSIQLPGDMRRLIEATYVERSEQGNMARWLHELEHGTRHRKGRVTLQQLARLGLATDGKTLPESKAQTRYSESDSFDVLLLRRIELLKNEKASRLTLLDGRTLMLPWYRGMLSKTKWKQLTVELMQQQVPARAGEAPAKIARDTLEKHGFQHCFYLGDPNWEDDESLLRVALVDETDTLHGLHGAPAHDKYTLEYRSDLGYRSIRS